MYTYLNKKQFVVGATAAVALVLLSALYFGVGRSKNTDVFRQPLLGEKAIVNGTLKNEKVVTPKPLSREAIAAVTVHTPTPSVPTPTPPATPQSFLSLFAGKKTSSVDISGVIETLNPAQGVIALKDTETGTRYTVFADARATITRGGESLTFAALKVADIVHVRGEREPAQQLVSATSIAIIGALPLPAAL